MLKMIGHSGKKKDAIKTVDASEWFGDVPYIQGNITLPDADPDYFYGAAKLCSEFPQQTLKATTYEPEDLTEDILDTLLGVQVNLRHDKIKQVVGNVIGYDKVDGGVEIAMRFDREQAAAHGLDPEDMKRGNCFSSVSLEISKDPTDSIFYVLDNQHNITKQIPYTQGVSMGMRRTLDSDTEPYKFQGSRVIERLKPLRFTGVGLVPNPADLQAKVYAVAADAESEDRLKVLTAEKETADSKMPYGKDVEYADPGFLADGVHRYPLNSPEHVRAAASYFSNPDNSGQYSPPQRAHIARAIAEAEKRHGIGDHKDTASTGAPTVETEIPFMELEAKLAELEASIASLRTEKEAASAETASVREQATAEITALKTELASVTAERDTLKSEKETAARDKQIDDVVTELEAIKACADEAQRVELREKASAAISDATALAILKLTRENEALKEVAAAAKKSAEMTDEEKAAKDKADKADKEAKEKASKETFSVTEPLVPIAPVVGTVATESTTTPVYKYF
jgi:hypothetical protein